MTDSEDNVVVMRVSDATAEEVSRAFTDDECPLAVHRCEAISELVKILAHEQIGLVAVDIDPVPEAMMVELTPVVRRFAGTCFVILSSQWNERLVLDAMAIGARHFMRKSSIRSELVEVVQRLSLTSQTGTQVDGTVVTVLSAGGGCGATTLAVNLANELRFESKPVLLIDMDLAYGAIATYLNIKGRYGLTDVVSNGNIVDGDLIASSTVPYADGLNVLMSPASVDFSAPRDINYDKMSDVLNACRQKYAFTIVDAPRVSPAVAATLAAASNATLAVLQMSVKDIRVVRNMRDSLLNYGIPPGNISLVINRYRKKGSAVTLAEIERAVNSDNIQLVRNDFRHAARSVDMGEPLAKAAPMSALRKDIKNLIVEMNLKPKVGSKGIS
jgi:pilus assembly protein CpaE